MDQIDVDFNPEQGRRCNVDQRRILPKTGFRFRQVLRAEADLSWLNGGRDRNEMVQFPASHKDAHFNDLSATAMESQFRSPRHMGHTLVHVAEGRDYA